MKHITSKLLSLLLTLAMLLSMIPAAYAAGTEGTTEGNTSTEKVVAKDGETTATTETLNGSTTVTSSNAATAVDKGTEANPYTLSELGAMTRDAYIAAQNALDGTMYVTVGDYSYTDKGTLGNGVRNDTLYQTEDRSVLNGYNSNGYLGEKNDGANGKNIVFVGGTITSGATGYTSIDNIGTSLLLAVPAYTNVTFEGITFNNVMSFDYQLYTSPWSQLGELKFDGCTFNGIIVGAIAAQTLTFNGCTFTDYTNSTSANNSNPTWIRPAYGNWTKDDNKGQGSDFKSLTTINFTGNTVTSTRPVKFERIAQWEMPTTVTATGNSFDISAQTDDTAEGKTKNVGLYFGANAKFDLVAENNKKAEGSSTAALYTAVYSAPDGTSHAGLPAGSTVKDSSGNDTTLTDALEWKGTKDDVLTLKTECEAKIGNAYYATLADAFAAANKTGDTVIELLDDINMTGKNWTPVKVDGYHGQGVITLNGNGKTITGLSAPLFAGGFAGKSGIVIKDLTIADANINDTANDQGIGAFINCVDSMTRIELDNCHLKNSKIVSTGGARVGGLIGWTSGYNNQNDGPVDTKVTLTNCSVENVTIEAKGSVGGLIGHAGANPATYHTITGCTVKDSTLKCTETGKSWRVGDLVGTANVGQVTVDAATSASQNFLTQENASTQKPEDSIFGRKEVGTDGLMIIDNKVVAAGTAYGDIVNKNANEVLVEVSKGHWVKPKEDTVAMIGAKEYPTLTAAINEANTGDTVKLVNNVTENVTIPAAKTITLDLNGMTLTNVDDHTILNNGNLTIMGTGRVDNISHAKGALYNKGTVVINGGTFDRSRENGMNKGESGQNSWYTIKNVGTMTINDGATVQTAGNNAALGKFSSLVSNGYFNANDYNTNKGLDQPILTIDGGTFRGGLNTIKNDDRARLTINGGTFSNYYQAVVQNHNIAEITGGTFTAASDANTETYGIYNCGCGAGIDLGTLTVSGGTFTGATYAVAEVSSQNAIVNISGGQFAGTKAAIIKSSTSNATIAISGGKFSSDPSVYVVGNGNTNIVKRDGSEGAYTYTVLAKSGLTSGVYLTNPSGALASNYYVSSTANGVWTVSYSAPSSGGGSSSSSRRYDVSAPSVKHGDVTVSPKNASKGDTVTITVKPDSGYELDTLTVKDASGSKIKVKDKGDGKFTFTMPASKVTVSAEFAEIETLDFTDVSTDAYYYEAVKWAAKKGITGGIGNGLFGPNQPCTRAQIVTFLWRAAGSPEPKSMSSFSDVSADSYYAKAVAWAVENGITTGTGDGKFSPDATCTRAQSVTFLFRAIGKLVDSKAEFSDVLTNSYYANAVAWAVENGVTNGIGDGLFGPDNSCTRAQIVTFLYRAYQGK